MAPPFDRVKSEERPTAVQLVQIGQIEQIGCHVARWRNRDQAGARKIWGRMSAGLARYA
jgi:hypothetical protein